MQYAYEDRIAELARQGRPHHQPQLLDQEQFDQKLDQIMRRRPRWNRAPLRWGRSGRVGDRINPRTGARSRGGRRRWLFG